MVCCSAYGCKNSTNKKVPGITFHMFPKDEERQRLWVNALRRKNFVLSKHSKICSAHFPEDMIDRTSLSCVRLRENAVPVIFSAFPKYLQNDEAIFQRWKRAIPQKDKEFSPESKVCELHFLESEVEKHFITKLSDGSIHKMERVKAQLKVGAVPSIFPNLPKYLSKPNSKRKLPAERSATWEIKKTKCSAKLVDTDETSKMLTSENTELLDTNDAAGKSEVTKMLRSENTELLDTNDSAITSEITKMFTSVRHMPLVTVPVSSRKYTNCELPLKEDSYQNTLLDGTFQNIDQQSIVSIKEEPISDSETEEIEKAKEKHDATNEIQSSFTIEKITVPNQWWAVSCTPKFILCAKWDASYVCERKVIIEDNLNVKVFLKDHEIFHDDFKLSSLVEVSSLLCEVDRYYICPGIDKFKEKCLKYQKERINGGRSVWCINCRNKQKVINYRLRKNPQLGLSQEERKKTKIEADKKYLKNILQQNRRLRKRVERLKNKVKILMHKDMTLDYDSTVKNIDVASDIDDIENDLDVESEMNMESDIDDVENEINMESDIDHVDNISSPISASEMVSNVFPVTPDTDMVVNASRSTFDTKKDEIATQSASHTGKVKNATIISSDSKNVGNTSQNQSVIFTSDIGKAQSVICNSSKLDKVKQTTRVISGTDIPGNFIQIAEIYITS